MKLISASASHIGKVRDRNEDSYFQYEPKGAKDKAKGALFMVADGMGGHSGGDIASRIAVETIKDHYYSTGNGSAEKILSDAFELANQAIINKALNDSSLFGMGTTCTAMAIKDDRAFFAHLGDSRAYLLRKNKLEQITQDHSLVGDMVRSGMISREDARNHPQRNIITKSLGSQEKIKPETPCSPLVLQKGDVIMLCSDGLTSFVGDDDIRNILSENPPKKACERLVSLANDTGGGDNITVQVVSICK